MQSSEPLRLATPACGSPIPDLANRDAPRGYLGQIYGSVACERVVPDVEGFHALALQRPIKPPLTEKETGAKEKDVKRLRDSVTLVADSHGHFLVEPIIKMAYVLGAERWRFRKAR